jgi:SAM-dependent methyltransferase
MPEQSAASPTPERIFQLAWGYTLPLIIESAIRNKVFDVLDGKRLSLEQVSSATGASIRGLKAIMNALIGLELLDRGDDGLYSLTPESDLFLVSTKPTFAGGILRHTSGQLIPKWLSITDIVRTGRPGAAVNQQAEGSNFFHEFVEDILPMSYPAASNLARNLDIESSTDKVSVLDIASGSGVWGIALAQASKNVRIRAIDWEHVLEVTRRVTAKFGVADRFEYVAGDLMTADLGTGHQFATLGHILHSEGEARSKQLLGRVFKALAPGGKIIIAEMVPNADRKGPTFPLLFAVNMLVNTDEGDTYSFDEISSWLTDAGYVEIYTMPGPGPSPLLLASKPK